MNVAALSLEGSQLILDPSMDVNETAAIAYSARESGIPGVGVQPLSVVAAPKLPATNSAANS